jgi:hypothetical protein
VNLLVYVRERYIIVFDDIELIVRALILLHLRTSWGLALHPHQLLPVDRTEKWVLLYVRPALRSQPLLGIPLQKPSDEGFRVLTYVLREL